MAPLSREVFFHGCSNLERRSRQPLRPELSKLRGNIDARQGSRCMRLRYARFVRPRQHVERAHYRLSEKARTRSEHMGIALSALVRHVIAERCDEIELVPRPRHRD